jgi:hypothetical protein
MDSSLRTLDLLHNRRLLLPGGVKKLFEILIYSDVNSGLSQLFSWPRSKILGSARGLLTLWFMCCASNSSDLCLMLSTAEESALLRAQEQARKSHNELPKNPIKLRLDGIIYSNHKSWTIWLNGRSIKPGQKVDALRILAVTPESVQLIWCPKPGETHQICLRPNEIFQTSNTLPETE